MFSLLNHHNQQNLQVVVSSRKIRKIWSCNVIVSLLCILTQCLYSYIGKDIPSWNCVYFVSEYILGLTLLLNFFISESSNQSQKVPATISKVQLRFYRKLVLFTLIPYLLFKIIYTILFYQHVSFIYCESSRYYWGVLGAYIVLISLIVTRIYHERD